MLLFAYLIYFISIIAFILFFSYVLCELIKCFRTHDRTAGKRCVWLCLVTAVFVTYFSFGWRLPAGFSLETLRVPAEHELYLPTKIIRSDAALLHIQGEKVLIFSQPYEEVAEYVQEHNSALARKNIIVSEFGNDMFFDMVYYPPLYKDYQSLTRDEKLHYVKLVYVATDMGIFMVQDALIYFVLALLLGHGSLQSRKEALEMDGTGDGSSSQDENNN